MLNVLVTGATGFLGSRLIHHLSAKGLEPIAVTRSSASSLLAGTPSVYVSDLCAEDEWNNVMLGVDVVIHAAGRAHVMKSESPSNISEDYFHKVNVVGTLALARSALKAGVKRFIFISSIGVNGTVSTTPFTSRSLPAPTGPYASSKLAAELELMKLTSASSMELVIIRPPLIYGPNAPGNFKRLISLVDKRYPLPFGLVNNKRSFIFIDNLTDFIGKCVQHPVAANQIFLVSDGQDISTKFLISRVGLLLNKKAFIFPLPIGFIKFIAMLLGKRNVFDKVFGSLQIDSAEAKESLSWTPPYTVEEALRLTASSYLEDQSNA